MGIVPYGWRGGEVVRFVERYINTGKDENVIERVRVRVGKKKRCRKPCHKGRGVQHRYGKAK